MRQSNHFVIVDSGHGFGRDHGIDDSFFGGLHRGGKEGFDFFIRQHFQIDDVIGKSSAGIRGGKGNEDVTGAVAGNAAVAT